MGSKRKLELEQVSSVDTAAGYVSELVSRETRSDDVEDALRRIEAKTGIGYWTLWGLIYKRPKSISADILDRIRGAYLMLCERQVANWLHKLEVERAKGGDDFDDLVRSAENVVAQLKAARAKRGAP